MKYLNKSILAGKRRENAHKGDFGRVLVVAGSEEYSGASLLATNSCKAVLRSGTDLVVAACPSKIAWLINSKIPDAITKKYAGKHFTVSKFSSVNKLAKESDVMLIGSGISKKAIPFAKKMLQNKIMKVIDADAIHAIDLHKVKNALITPHANEFKALLKNSKLNEKNFRKNLGNNVILLKGRIDKIISKDKIAYNKTGNSVMTKGGTGDVLAGLCAGFVSQGNSLFKSACMAAYLNGAVGDALKKKKGRTFIASDIVENLHLVYH